MEMGGNGNVESHSRSSLVASRRENLVPVVLCLCIYALAVLFFLSHSCTGIYHNLRQRLSVCLFADYSVRCALSECLRVAAPAPKCPTGETPVCPMCVYASSAAACSSAGLQEECTGMYDVSETSHS